MDEGIVNAHSNMSRCRLIASWGWRSSQGFGCSPIKAVRELGSERRETVDISHLGINELSINLAISVKLLYTTQDNTEETLSSIRGSVETVRQALKDSIREDIVRSVR